MKLLEILLSGTIGAVIGSIAGGVVTACLTFCFQKKLMKQQEDFQEKLLDKQLTAHNETSLASATGGNSITKQIQTAAETIAKAINSKS